MAKYIMQAVSGGVGGDGEVKTWLVDEPDFAGVDFPGPGTAVGTSFAVAARTNTNVGGVGPTGPTGPPGSGEFGSTGPTGPTGGAPSSLGRHDTTHSPVLLYQFDGSLADSSGNGWNLAVDSGTERYSDALPGLRGIALRSTRLIYNTFQSALAITGDYTAEMIVSMLDVQTASRWLFSFGGTLADDAEANNFLYAGLIGTGPVLQHFSEHGSGTDDSYTLDDLPPQGQACHLAVTRTSNVIQWYLNGRAWGAASSALTTPTTTGSGPRFRIGAESANAPDCIMSSFKLVGSALSAAQIKAEYNRTLGQLFGQLP